MESRRCTSFAVPSVTATSACVWPRVNSAEPCARGSTLVSIEIARTSFGLRPSTRLPGVEHLRAQRVVLDVAEHARRCPWRCPGISTRSASATSFLTSSTACDARVLVLLVDRLDDLRFGVQPSRARRGRPAGSAFVHAIFGVDPPALSSSSCIPISSLDAACARR